MHAYPWCLFSCMNELHQHKHSQLHVCYPSRKHKSIIKMGSSNDDMIQVGQSNELRTRALSTYFQMALRQLDIYSSSLVP
ncbi:hypothetical protein HanRHA438_Chr06g0266001 [Helianthus annuus]|nr:hypothetical protein HanRHA438_Chr06g0266001 [Helianthus annuus]